MTQQNNSGPLSRRKFLRLSAFTAAGVGLAACGGEPPAPVVAPTSAVEPTVAAVAPTAAPQATAAPQPTAAPVASSGYNEAPMLADLVAQGKLPPVAERLPKNPVVLDSIAGTGNYGGTLRRGFNGVSDYWGPNKVQQVGIVAYSEDLSLRPDLIESWELNDDATVWTLHLREGLKWSDGSELTSENFTWWHDNVLNHPDLKDLQFTGRADYSTGNPLVPVTVTASDPYTVVLTFAHPKPLFMHTQSRGQPFVPIEFMKQFHADFTDMAELEAKAKEAQFDTWAQLFNDRNRPNIFGRPSLGRWVPKNDFFKDELFILERNPYFHQVDSAGNQLPYIDTVQHLRFDSPEAFTARIIAGDVDYQNRHTSIGNFTLYKENEQRGNYSVVLGVTAGHIAFQPNHTTKEPKLREFFQNRDVRIALSHAINRSEINELAFNGTSVPRQYSPLQQSPQYYPEGSNAYIEYDPEKANQLLDAAGYNQRDANGVRQWKDGSGPISFVIEGTALTGDPIEDAAQTVVKYFNDVGIQASYKAVERSLYTEHYTANEIESAFWGGDRTLLPMIAPIIWLGTQPDRPWAPAWGFWKNTPDDPNAEQPPEGHFITKIWSIWDEVAAEPDEGKRNTLFRQILDIWATELPMIGVLGELPAPVITKNGLMGVKPGFAIDDPTSDEHFLQPQTFYWDDPAAHN
jgi:peptide/nickel transport system substrate-binding protein